MMSSVSTTKHRNVRSERARERRADLQVNLRQHLLELLGGGSAHVDFDTALAKLPPKLRGAKPVGQPHTPWRLLEHMRIAQWDIVRFTIEPNHVSPSWPDGYWPEGDGPAGNAAWNTSIRDFHTDLQAMQDLIANPTTDLLAPLEHGTGQTIAREAMLLADHTAYHLGQMIIVRRLLGAWPD